MPRVGNGGTRCSEHTDLLRRYALQSDCHSGTRGVHHLRCHSSAPHHVVDSSLRCSEPRRRALGHVGWPNCFVGLLSILTLRKVQIGFCRNTVWAEERNCLLASRLCNPWRQRRAICTWVGDQALFMQLIHNAHRHLRTNLQPTHRILQQITRDIWTTRFTCVPLCLCIGYYQWPITKARHNTLRFGQQQQLSRRCYRTMFINIF